MTSRVESEGGGTAPSSLLGGRYCCCNGGLSNDSSNEVKVDCVLAQFHPLSFEVDPADVG